MRVWVRISRFYCGEHFFWQLKPWWGKLQCFFSWSLSKNKDFLMFSLSLNCKWCRNVFFSSFFGLGVVENFSSSPGRSGTESMNFYLLSEAIWWCHIWINIFTHFLWFSLCMLSPQIHQRHVQFYKCEVLSTNWAVVPMMIINNSEKY